MNIFIKGLLNQFARTENNAKTLFTSDNFVLDFFFLAGAARNLDEPSILKSFINALNSDFNKTLKVLFWARNCRGGAGERRLFRICYKYLAQNYPKITKLTDPNVYQFGRFDDIFDTSEEYILSVFTDYQAGQVHERFNLLCKWFPRKGKLNSKIRKSLGITPKDFRKILVNNSNVVENKMCSKKWDTIDYPKTPSRAMNVYKKAFIKHDKLRFEQYVKNVSDGIDKINAELLYPYEIYKSYLLNRNSPEIVNLVNVQWKSLKNYLPAEKDYRLLPICDVSGSMSGEPMLVSVSLGLYVSERNNGTFKDAFITFSENPKLQYLTGSIIDRFMQLETSEWGMNTNLYKTFELILNTAIQNKLSNEDIPNILLIISDMEFDQGVDINQTLYDQIDTKFKSSGYQLPKIVFWNVRGRSGNVPVNASLKNVGLVSGFSPAILESVLSCEDFTPLGIMNKTISNPTYSFIDKIEVIVD